MKNIFTFYCIFILQIFNQASVNAQSSNFNLNSYKQFLQSNQNISAETLLQMHDAGKFASSIHQDYSSAVYFDSINAKFNLTGYEKSLLLQNGFMVSERLASNSFGGAFLDIFKKDLPVFVSTDAILYSLHISYDRILKDFEVSVLIDSVKSMLIQMESQVPSLTIEYANNPVMIQMLKDVDFYLTVGIDLITGQTSNPV